jgi:Uma2 family endonuclease
MLLSERLYSVDEFEEFIRLPENADKNWELIEGVIYEVSPTMPRHGYIAAFFIGEIFAYLKMHDLGVVMGTDVGFRLNPKTLCSPDVAFISNEHPDAKNLNKFADFAPDIAVEVISPSNTFSEITHKTKLYLQYGTRLVWVVYPEQKEIHVYRAGQTSNEATITYLKEQDTLSGEDVLPGFILQLAEIFK